MTTYEQIKQEGRQEGKQRFSSVLRHLSSVIRHPSSVFITPYPALATHPSDYEQRCNKVAVGNSIAKRSEHADRIH